MILLQTVVLVLAPALAQAQSVDWAKGDPVAQARAGIGLAGPVPPVPAPAPAGDLAKLNEALVEALRPFNNAASRASAVFAGIQVNARRAVRAALALAFEKKGPRGSFALKVDEFEYSYPEDSSRGPETKARASTEFDLLRELGQEHFNRLESASEQWVKDFVEQFARSYGDAARVEAKVTRKEKDSQGNLTALGLSLSARVDLAKLPPRVDPRDVLITGLEAAFLVTRRGAEASVRAVSNPGAKQFEADQKGLKEALDGLLAREPKRIAEVVSLFKLLDRWASRVTEPRGED